MLEIDHYAYKSRWRTVNPLLKATIFIILLLVALLSTPRYQCVILFILIPLTLYAARISLKKYLRWLMVPAIFLIISMISIVLSFAWDNSQMLCSVHIASFYIGVNEFSLVVARDAFFRSFSCLSVTYWFVFITPFDQMIVIGKKARMPKSLLEQVLLTYRFIFIFLDEVANIKRAQTLRFGYISLKCSYHSLGMLVGILLQRVLLRHKQMSITLETKLFKGDFPL